MKTYIRPEVKHYEFELNYIVAVSTYGVSDTYDSSNTEDTGWDSRENSNNKGGGSNMWDSGW